MDVAIKSLTPLSAQATVAREGTSGPGNNVANLLVGVPSTHPPPAVKTVGMPSSQETAPIVVLGMPGQNSAPPRLYQTLSAEQVLRAYQRHNPNSVMSAPSIFKLV